MGAPVLLDDSSLTPELLGKLSPDWFTEVNIIFIS